VYTLKILQYASNRRLTEANRQLAEPVLPERTSPGPSVRIGPDLETISQKVFWHLGYLSIRVL